MDECYICYDSTINKSPCICRSPLCTECYIEYLGYSDKCRICNTEFVDRDLINDTCFEDFAFFLFCAANLLFIIIFGSIFVSLINGKLFRFEVTLQILFCGVIIDAIFMWIMSFICNDCFKFIKEYCRFTIMRFRLFCNC